MQVHLDKYNNYKNLKAYSKEELEDTDAWFLEIQSKAK